LTWQEKSLETGLRQLDSGFCVDDGCPLVLCDDPFIPTLAAYIGFIGEAVLVGQIPIHLAENVGGLHLVESGLLYWVSSVRQPFLLVL